MSASSRAAPGSRAERFRIQSSAGGYEVAIGSGLLADLAGREAQAIVIADARFANTRFDDALPFAPERVIAVGASEDNKSLERMAPLIEQLRQAGAGRSSHLVAIGGGIVQDISTFIASIYMRGLAWTYAPTTLLAMADSCIGGKSSINVGGYKNLVGNFHPPVRVAIDLDFVRTLAPAQIVEGLCEAAKICYAKGSFADYLAAGPAVAAEPEMARRVVELSLRAKQWFVETDEFDRDERLLLNFGHTFGHAVESVSGFAISHGIAVGIGILVAEAYAQANGLLKARGAETVAALSSHIAALLRAVPGLGAEVAKLDPAAALSRFENDKKHLAAAYRIVVPGGDGRLALLSLPRDVATRAGIEAAFAAGFARALAALTLPAGAAS